MIQNFWVENYLSISGRQGMDFLSRVSDSPFVAEASPGVWLNKLAVLFGANASGKTNMLVAMNTLFHVMVDPRETFMQGVVRACPFMPTQDTPTRMHISFYAASVRYDYDVEFDKRRILREELAYYPNTKRALFYERTYVGDDVQADIRFGASLGLSVRTQNGIREHTLNNHSVLSVCAKNAFTADIAPLTSLHRWIMEHYHEIDGEKEQRLVERLEAALTDDRKRGFYEQMLRKADLNITGFKVVEQDRVIPKALRESIEEQNLPENVKQELLNATVKTAVFTNSYAGETFDVPLSLQSKGTRKYVDILDVMYDCITGSHTYFLDELGEDFHGDLLRYYIEVFLYNSNSSQLILTSQEAELLMLDLFNEHRELVWFVDKNRETASSQYKRADRLGLHKNLSLYNAYKIGRLGAVPQMGAQFINI